MFSLYMILHSSRFEPDPSACVIVCLYMQRCDGEKPTCGRCAQSGRTDCTYGRGPPPSADARLQAQFADFGQRVGVITPMGYEPAAQGNSSAASSSSSSSSRSRTPAPSMPRAARPPEFPGPSEIYGLGNWDGRGELPVYTRQHMWVSILQTLCTLIPLLNSETVSLPTHRLNILIPQRSQFSMDFHYGRWRQTIVLPSSDPNSFHPCLVWAIALAAVSLCSMALSDYEPLFRAHAQAELANSLAYADRLEDSMWARVILAWHSIRQGRLMAVCMQWEPKYDVDY